MPAAIQRSTRLLYTELLESRRLLSALAATSSADPLISNVIVVEHAPVIEEPEEEDTQIAPDALPAAVLQALRSRFPSAQIIAAEFGEEDGELEYEISANVGDDLVEVAFAPDGQIVEEEEIIPPDELPQAVRDWIEQTHPGAEIDEAAVVTEDGRISYDVDLTTGDGEEFEATLRVSDDDASEGADEPDVVTEDDVGSAFEFDHADLSEATAPDDAEAAQDTANSAADDDAAPASQQQQQPTADPATNGSISAKAASVPIGFFPIETIAVRDAAAALVDGLNATWLPEAATALADLVPRSAETIQERLQQLLTNIESAADSVSQGPLTAERTLRLAVLAALLIAVRIMLVDSRKPGGGPLSTLTALVSRDGTRSRTFGSRWF